VLARHADDIVMSDRHRLARVAERRLLGSPLLAARDVPTTGDLPLERVSGVA
jgi:hypothetical protein